MSSFLVTVERLIIHPHPNADVLELAQVGQYKAVVKKGQYHTGDLAVYIPEQAIVPDVLLEELNLTGKLKGSKHNRVGAIRLRGELSQGIVFTPSDLSEHQLASAHAERTDLASRYGITKWIPEVPSSLMGEIQAAADLLPWIDIENIKRYPDIFTHGESVIASEKLHGSACLLTSSLGSDEWLVSSKGFGSKSLSILEADTNLYWRALRSHLTNDLLQGILTKLGASRLGVFGEVYGAGVQDLAYGRLRKDQPGYAVFDMAAIINGEKRWLEQYEVHDLLANLVPTAPTLYKGPYDYALLEALAEGNTTLGADHIREGLVVRAAPERRSDVVGGRAIGKIVSGAYLTRKGGTEYE